MAIVNDKKLEAVANFIGEMEVVKETVHSIQKKTS